MPNGFNALELQVLAQMGVGPNDPAAGAMLEAIASTREKQLAGDPAFQPGSRYFESRHGAGVERALGLFESPEDEDGLIELIMSLLGEGGLGGGRGYVSVAQQEAAEVAAATAAYERALQMMGLEQAFEREQTGLELGRSGEQSRFGRESTAKRRGMRQTGEKKQRGREMTQAGQASTIDIFGRDPAMGVLFELGALGGGAGEMPLL